MTPTMRTIGAASLCLLLAAGTSLAAEIVVTTEDDVVADDGRCSLREAVTAANHQVPSGSTPGECPAGDSAPAVDVIRLPRGTYSISLGQPGDDTNAFGDLDVLESVSFEGAGYAATVIENGYGEVEAFGDGDRLFHVDPAASGRVDVAFRGLTLRRGDTACTGIDCRAGGAAIDQRGEGRVVVEACRVVQNSTSCVGQNCGDSHHAAAIWAVGGGDLTILDSVVDRNRSYCSDTDCRAGAPAVFMDYVDSGSRGSARIERSRFRRNSSRCEAEDCRVEAIVTLFAEDATLSRVLFRRNDVSCVGQGCDTDEVLDLALSGAVEADDLKVKANSIRCVGASCDVDEFVDFGAAESSRFSNVVVSGNRATCTGTDCDTDDLLDISVVPGDVTVSELRLVRNILSCEGDRCETNRLFDLLAGGIVLTDSEIRSNRNFCVGLECAVDEIFDVSAVSRDSGLVIERTLVSRNQASCDGRTCRSGAILGGNSEGHVVGFDLVLSRNRVQCIGLGCVGAAALALSSADGIEIQESTIERNEVSCLAVGCQGGSVMELAGAGAVDIAHTDILGNESDCDGTLCFPGTIVSNLADRMVVVDSRVARNDTMGAGGAFQNTADSTLLLARVELHENFALRTGGAIHNPRRGILGMEDSSVRSNRSSSGAGGISNEGTVLTVRNTTFADNTPTGTDCVDVGDGTGCP